MATSSILWSFIFLTVFSSFCLHTSADSPRRFIECLTKHSTNSESISQVIFTPANASYNPILQLTLQNLRFNNSETRKPLVIITPVDESQIQSVIYCARQTNMNIRIRGGGHDFEGVSYTASVPFIMLDMINFDRVNIDLKSRTAWVQPGLSLGQLYYKISQTSDVLAFPAGLWSTVGITGFLGGGGYGMMKRKYGLAADNTLDARIMDFNGKIHDRKSMGEDLFWAIRGGDPASFCVVLEWKIKLVPVPKLVTYFAVLRTLEQNGSALFQKWQTIAPNVFPRDLDVRVVVDTITTSSSAREDKKTVRFVFQSLFLGKIDTLLPIMQEHFPELGLRREDCLETSWIQTAPLFSNFTVGTDPKILLNKTAIPRPFVKIKSSFAAQPISLEGLNGIWDLWLKQPVQTMLIQYTPFGGRMNEFAESALPFPHRPGVLYMINMAVTTAGDAGGANLKWINDLFKYYAPFVTKNPRTSYVNYRDADLGTGSKTYEEASIWGKKYYKNNFDRLVKIKSVVDPQNFFNHKQSIPLLY
ncbi:Xanthine dehydrogenase C subunit [Heracleum sosnowskyi]|uniref:Xanthine dehydrogenase C subunit n=1 Tax=Heracleum sosnowskyi TaxID=360622 RepID=A0AAD8HNQ0_9APIA|nr:Xanthine dehydrogenase C subunit [Heracleum sosnowskyi]